MGALASPDMNTARVASLAELIAKGPTMERILRERGPQVRPAATQLSETTRQDALARATSNATLLAVEEGGNFDPALQLSGHLEYRGEAEALQCFPVEQTRSRSGHLVETIHLTHNGNGLLKLEEHYLQGSPYEHLNHDFTVIHMYDANGEAIGTQKRYKRGTSQDRTSMVDTTYLMRNEAGLVTKKIIDIRTDGNPEEITLFFYNEDGLLDQEEIDLDADGNAELVRTFLYEENGALRKVIEDRGNDGVRDVMKDFFYTASGELFRIRIDNGADGEADAIETFTHQEGLLVATLRTALVSGESQSLTLFGYDEMGNQTTMASDTNLDGTFDQVTETQFECE
jgi:hypothetical protein